MANSKKVALVTDSNRGIGFETARQLGQHGVTVIVSARAEREAIEAARKLRSEGIEALRTALLDVTNAADRLLRQIHRVALHQAGYPGRNAGVGPADGIIGLRASASTEGELQSIFNINLFSLAALTRELLPLLKKSERGRIVNLASILGLLTLQAMEPSPIAPLHKFAFNASKSGGQHVHHPSGGGNSRTPTSRVNSSTVLARMRRPCLCLTGAKTTVAVALLGSDSPSAASSTRSNHELPW